MKFKVIQILLLSSLCTQASPCFNALFSDNMVLQREKPVPVYGTADPGETVIVEFAGQKKTTVTDSSNHWKVFLDPMPASSESRKLIVRSLTGNQTELVNVLVGDVWLCAGQSNMQTTMGFYPTLLDETLSMTNSLIRLFKIKEGGVPSPEPTDKMVIDSVFNSSWQECAPIYAKNFSAVAMFFGCRLQVEIGVPVGLISANRGGTRVSSWQPREVLKSRPEYARYLSKANPDWHESKSNPGGIKAPSYLFNGTIYPLAPFAIKGVIWYQGESNTKHPELYAMEMDDLIHAWRNLWGDDFYFIGTQLSSYGGVGWDRSGEAWAWLRDAQTKMLNLEKTDLAVTYDAGEYLAIHPQNKQPVGERLALVASKIDIPSIVAHGPQFESAEFKNGEGIISFKKGTADGLEARRVAMNRKGQIAPGRDPEAYVVPEDVLSGFTVCGANQKFVSASARIDGDCVIVSSPSVPVPVAVRYGWSNFVMANLYNAAGLPAVPFRSDAFEMPEFELKIPSRLFGGGTNGRVFEILDRPDSAFVKTEVAGQPCYQNLSAGQAIRFMYFKAPNAVPRGKVMLNIVYLDQDYFDIYVRYDSSDETIGATSSTPGAWKDAGIIKLNNSGQWRVATVELDDAKFAHRCHGGDVRLQVYGDFDYFIHSVSVE